MRESTREKENSVTGERHCDLFRVRREQLPHSIVFINRAHNINSDHTAHARRAVGPTNTALGTRLDVGSFFGTCCLLVVLERFDWLFLGMKTYPQR